MPKRTDLRKILVIGSGPIVIGQGAEFDYSGTQAAKALREEGLVVAEGGIATTLDGAFEILELTGFPAIIRPAFTLGGSGGGIAYNRQEFEEIIRRGLDLSPLTQVLVERSVIGWKEFELEVMRDGADNVVIVCSIENIDPMGIHTGDSITVA